MDSILDWPTPRACCSSSAPARGPTSRCSASSKEKLAGGGDASGPVSFMKGFDALRRRHQERGKTRRAAKMVILNADHPDILEFVRCKAEEEKKAWALIDADYDASFNWPGAYDSVFFQNSNNSVRVTDDFMQAPWWKTPTGSTHAVTDGRPMETYQGAPSCSGRSPRRRTSAATRECSSTPPSTTGTPARTRRASTPRTRAASTCSWTTPRAISASSTSCTSGTRDGEFDVEALPEARDDICIPAQEIIVDPRLATPRRADRRELPSRSGRWVSGYANLGALLMSRGHRLRLRRRVGPSRRRDGAHVRRGVRAVGAHRRGHMGPFAGSRSNREPMLRVIRQAPAAARELRHR